MNVMSFVAYFLEYIWNIQRQLFLKNPTDRFLSLLTTDDGNESGFRNVVYVK